MHALVDPGLVDPIPQDVGTSPATKNSIPWAPKRTKTMPPGVGRSCSEGNSILGPGRRCGEHSGPSARNLKACLPRRTDATSSAACISITHNHSNNTHNTHEHLDEARHWDADLLRIIVESVHCDGGARFHMKRNGVEQLFAPAGIACA